MYDDGMSPNDIGCRAEGEVLAALLRCGYAVLLPFGVARYDLVFDDGRGFHRVQVKKGRLVRGSVRFHAASEQTDKRPRYYTADEIEFFGVYCDSNVYLVPVGDVGTEGCLRINPPRNNQITNIHWAKQYLLTGP